MQIVEKLTAFGKAMVVDDKYIVTRSGDEIACIKGMQRKNLITKEKAESLIESYMFGYTE